MREVFSRGWKLLPVSRRGLERFVRWLQLPSPDINILQSTQRTTEPEPEMFLPTPGSGPCCAMRDAEMCNGLNIVQSTQPRAHTQRQETRDSLGTRWDLAEENGNRLYHQSRVCQSDNINWPPPAPAVTDSQPRSVKINCRWSKHDCAVRDVMLVMAGDLTLLPPDKNPAEGPAH